MTGEKRIEHYLVGLNREAVRLYQGITELPGYVLSSVLPWRGFAPGPLPEVLIPDASKPMLPWVIARSPVQLVGPLWGKDVALGGQHGIITVLRYGCLGDPALLDSFGLLKQHALPSRLH